MPGIGKVIQVLGPVIDCRFPTDSLPGIYNAVQIKDVARGVDITCEVAQHLGDDIVRTVALASTDGLVRGMDVVDTGGPITVPVRDRNHRPRPSPGRGLGGPLARVPVLRC